ncbi:unnamed protein product, partial [marine sediment metagenome]
TGYSQSQVTNPADVIPVSYVIDIAELKVNAVVRAVAHSGTQ